MQTSTDDKTKPAHAQGSANATGATQDVASLLAAAGNGIRITGLVLTVDPQQDRKGESKGRAYAFTSREMQIFTGNKSVKAKHQGDIGTQLPVVIPGTVRTFKVRSIRMNGTEPIFDLEFTD